MTEQAAIQKGTIMHIRMHDLSIRNTEVPPRFKIIAEDPGWLYMLIVGNCLKVGKKTNPGKRFREACTWLPAALLGGLKPFWCIHRVEADTLSGLADHWVQGEWHAFNNENELSAVAQDFNIFFGDHDMNRNSIDYYYWIGCTGRYNQMVEHSNRGISLRKWQLEAKEVMQERERRRISMAG